MINNKEIQQKHAGSYKCEATNDAGRNPSKVVMITVHEKPGNQDNGKFFSRRWLLLPSLQHNFNISNPWPEIHFFYRKKNICAHALVLTDGISRFVVDMPLPARFALQLT